MGTAARDNLRGLELIFLVASLGGGHDLTIQMHRQRTSGNFACGIKAETFIILYHDQPWDFFGRNDAKAKTPVIWPPHVKS